MRHIVLLLVGAFIGFMLTSRFGSGMLGKEVKADTTVVHDTSFIEHDTMVYRELKVKEIIHDTLPPRMIPNPMYDSLVVQYRELADDYLARRIYQDTLKIDSIGYVAVADTVKNNTLLTRGYTSKYKVPVIKETITIVKPAPATREVYFGGGVSANKTSLGAVNLGVLYKDRKDCLYGTYVAAGINGKLTYGVQTYWKIKPKQKP